MNALAVDGLTKTYPSFTLDHMSFTLGRGRIMGLIGKNGAGKSTTIKSILHLVSPDSGHVEVLGMDMADQEAACKQAMGVVLGGAGPRQTDPGALHRDAGEIPARPGPIPPGGAADPG